LLPGPLGRRIGPRNELRDNVAGGAPRGIVKGRQIFLHRATGPLRIAIPAPILTRDRALLVGIGRNPARIDGKAFATNQIGRNARLDDPSDFCNKICPIAASCTAANWTLVSW
jgi:hypothetical protein